jgi:beta-lactamase class A
VNQKPASGGFLVEFPLPRLGCILEKPMRKIHLDFSLASRSRTIVIFIAGIFVGSIFVTEIAFPTISVKRANDPDFAYINPLLTVGISENKEFSEYKPLESKIDGLLAKADKTKVATASVYYRELTNGRWFGINENALYSPASLLKVPVMIAYYKEAESDPSILSKTFTYTGRNLNSNNEYFKSPTQIVKGRSYTVQSLIEAMVKHSDNAAADILYNNTDPNSLAESLSDIGIQLPDGSLDAADADFVSVKTYSYLFRLLYNSTYLSRTNSEKALELLSDTDFVQGLRAGVPASIPVVHKFGERTLLNNDHSLKVKELHDCGIIYYPQHPYLLCIMTKGTDFKALADIIKNISDLVYANMKSTAK